MVHCMSLVPEEQAHYKSFEPELEQRGYHVSWEPELEHLDYHMSWEPEHSGHCKSWELQWG